MESKSHTDADRKAAKGLRAWFLGLSLVERQEVLWSEDRVLARLLAQMKKKHNSAAGYFFDVGGNMDKSLPPSLREPPLLQINSGDSKERLRRARLNKSRNRSTKSLSEAARSFLNGDSKMPAEVPSFCFRTRSKMYVTILCQRPVCRNDELLINALRFKDVKAYCDAVLVAKEVLTDGARFLRILNISSRGNFLRSPCRVRREKRDWVWDQPKWFTRMSYYTLGTYTSMIVEQMLWKGYFRHTGEDPRAPETGTASFSFPNLPPITNSLSPLMNFWQDLSFSQQEAIIERLLYICHSQIKDELVRPTSSILQKKNVLSVLASSSVATRRRILHAMQCPRETASHVDSFVGYILQARHVLSSFIKHGRRNFKSPVTIQPTGRNAGLYFRAHHHQLESPRLRHNLVEFLVFSSLDRADRPIDFIMRKLLICVQQCFAEKIGMDLILEESVEKKGGKKSQKRREKNLKKRQRGMKQSMAKGSHSVDLDASAALPITTAAGSGSPKKSKKKKKKKRKSASHVDIASAMPVVGDQQPEASAAPRPSEPHQEVVTPAENLEDVPLRTPRDPNRNRSSAKNSPASTASLPPDIAVPEDTPSLPDTASSMRNDRAALFDRCNPRGIVQRTLDDMEINSLDWKEVSSKRRHKPRKNSYTSSRVSLRTRQQASSTNTSPRKYLGQPLSRSHSHSQFSASSHSSAGDRPHGQSHSHISRKVSFDSDEGPPTTRHAKSLPRASSRSNPSSPRCSSAERVGTRSRVVRALTPRTLLSVKPVSTGHHTSDGSDSQAPKTPPASLWSRKVSVQRRKSFQSGDTRSSLSTQRASTRGSQRTSKSPSITYSDIAASGKLARSGSGTWTQSQTTPSRPSRVATRSHDDLSSKLTGRLKPARMLHRVYSTDDSRSHHQQTRRDAEDGKRSRNPWIEVGVISGIDDTRNHRLAPLMSKCRLCRKHHQAREPCPLAAPSWNVPHSSRSLKERGRSQSQSSLDCGASDDEAQDPAPVPLINPLPISPATLPTSASMPSANNRPQRPSIVASSHQMELGAPFTIDMKSALMNDARSTSSILSDNSEPAQGMVMRSQLSHRSRLGRHFRNEQQGAYGAEDDQQQRTRSSSVGSRNRRLATGARRPLVGTGSYPVSPTHRFRQIMPFSTPPSVRSLDWNETGSVPGSIDSTDMSSRPYTPSFHEQDEYALSSEPYTRASTPSYTSRARHLSRPMNDDMVLESGRVNYPHRITGTLQHVVGRRKTSTPNLNPRIPGHPSTYYMSRDDELVLGQRAWAVEYKNPSQTRSDALLETLDRNATGFRPRLAPTAQIAEQELHRNTEILSTEIEEFVENIDSVSAARKPAMNSVVKRVQAIAASLWPDAKVEPFGSFATGLCIPSSDLDIVAHVPTQQDLTDATLSRSMIVTWLHDMAAVLTREKTWVHGLKTIFTAQVPVIKFIASVRGLQVNVDITMATTREDLSPRSSLRTSQHTGLYCAEIILQYLKTYSAMKPLVLVLKSLLHERNLHNVYTGGLSSYCLILMVVSYLHSVQTRRRHARPASWTGGMPSTEHEEPEGSLSDPEFPALPTLQRSVSAEDDSKQHRRRTSESETMPRSGSQEQLHSRRSQPKQSTANLGALLLGFLRFYGIQFDYHRNFIRPPDPNDASDDSCFFTLDTRTDTLVILDPLNSTNNVGKSVFGIFRIKPVFDYALSALSAPFQAGHSSLLNRIMRPT